MLQKTRSLLIKLIMLLCVVCCAVALAIGLSGCASERTVERMELSGNTIIVYYSDGTTDEIDLSSLEDCDCTMHTSDHEVNVWTLKEHTCDENNVVTNGVYLEVCSDPTCGYSQIIYDEAHHEWGEAQDIEATCTTNAYEDARQCIICGYIDGGTELPGTALGHTWENEDEYDPLDRHPIYNAGDIVCEDGGLYITLCQRCDAYLISDAVEVLGHTITEWTLGTTPTETTTGTLYGDCIDCSRTVTLVLPTFTLDNAATIDGEATENANGFYDVVTVHNGGCAEDSEYEFTINFATGDKLTVNSFKGSTAQVSATSAVDFTHTYEVTIKGGKHYFTDSITGQRVNIDIADLSNPDPNYNILQYEEFQTFVNVDYTCGQVVAGYVFFVCEACNGNVLINVYGYHTNSDGEKIEYVYDEDGNLNPDVIYHPATCSTPEYWSVVCHNDDCFCKNDKITSSADIAPNKVYNNETIIRVGAPADGESHNYKVTITGTAPNYVVEYECTICGEHGVIENATVTTDTTTTVVGGRDDCYTVDTIYHVTYVDPNTGETVTEDFKESVEHGHGIVVDGVSHDIVYGQVINSDDVLADYVQGFVNVPESCDEDGVYGFIVCDVCGGNVLVEYRVAHTFDDGWVLEPTCEDDGKKHCTVCGEDIIIENSALGHRWVLESWAATGEKDSNNNDLYVLEIYCSRCGSKDNTTTVEGAIIDNVRVAQSCDTDGIVDFWKAATSTEPAYNFDNVNIGKSYHLFADGTHNGQSLAGTEIVGYEGGNFVYNLTEYDLPLEGFVNVPISCGDETGLAFVICQTCGGNVLIRVSGEHDAAHVETVVEATHTHPAVYHCTVCGDYYLGSTLGGEHEWEVDESSLVKPTEKATGSITYVCDCGAEFTVELPALADSDSWSAIRISGGCDGDVVWEYSISIKYVFDEEDVTFTYTNAEADVELTYVPTAAERTVELTYSFRNDAKGTGHTASDGKNYEWYYPEGEDSVTYVGYICGTCNQMVVIWASDGSVGDDKPTVDVTLGQLYIEYITE